MEDKRKFHHELRTTSALFLTNRPELLYRRHAGYVFMLDSFKEGL